MRRWVPLAIVMLASTAALTTGVAAKPPRPAAPVEATAPREAGEPIMAVVSIKSQKVTFYDADGWILRAPVSTGTTGRETPAGVFALIEKDKDTIRAHDDAGCRTCGASRMVLRYTMATARLCGLAWLRADAFRFCGCSTRPGSACG